MAETAEFIEPIEIDAPPPEASSITNVYEPPLPDLSSVTNVDDSDLLLEDERPGAPPFVAPTFPKAPAGPSVWQRIAKIKNKGTLVAWAVTGLLGLLVVLQRSGGFHSMAAAVGQAHEYEALEKVLIGGPGSGTVRSAKQRFEELVPQDSVPFAMVHERVSGGR
jgi:hypothetical protein